MSTPPRPDKATLLPRLNGSHGNGRSRRGPDVMPCALATALRDLGGTGFRSTLRSPMRSQSCRDHGRQNAAWGHRFWRRSGENFQGAQGGGRILVRDNWEVRSCCLTKECYPTDCCRFTFLLLFFRGLPGAKRPAPADFQLFCSSHFNWRLGGLAQATEHHLFHALGAPCLDPALQRS
jgi:hypothetical protein